jgi:predicted hotdog family 3-hydroxylacyl-ACP dehydratase
VLNRDAIAARIPHSGNMCLLDRVLDWNHQDIHCSTATHRELDNPLREPRGLPVWAGIEYAAQAAAVHGALINPLPAPRSGVLGALRRVSFNCEWLDRIEQDLIVAATLRHHDQAGGIYAFEIHAGTNCLLCGECTLMYVKSA